MVLYWTESVQFIVRTGLASCRLIHQLDLGLSDNVWGKPLFPPAISHHFPDQKIDINLGYNRQSKKPHFQLNLQMSFKLEHNYHRKKHGLLVQYCISKFIFIQVSYHRTWPPHRYTAPHRSIARSEAVKIQLTTPVLLRVVLVSMQIWPEGLESVVWFPWCAHWWFFNQRVKHQNEGYNKQLMVI